MEKFLLKYSSVVLYAPSLLLQPCQQSHGKDLQTMFPSENQKIRKFYLFVCVIILFKNAFLIYYIQAAVFPSPSPHSSSSSNFSLSQIHSSFFCCRKRQASRDINQTRHKVGVKLDTFPHIRLYRATSRRKRVL